jgi:uncharacterized protein HemX
MEESIGQIANPVFSDQLAGQLTTSGHELIAVALVLLQILVIPFALLIFKNWQVGQKKQIDELQKAHKQIIDLETEKRKMIRDDQIKTIENRIGHLEKDNDQKIDDMAKQMDRMNATMTRLFEKFDRLTEKMEELVIRMVKLEK